MTRKKRIEEIDEQAGKQLNKIKQKNSQKEKEQSGWSGWKTKCFKWKENMSCERIMKCQRWQRDKKSNKQGQEQQESSLAETLTSLM